MKAEEFDQCRALVASGGLGRTSRGWTARGKVLPFRRVPCAGSVIGRRDLDDLGLRNLDPGCNLRSVPARAGMRSDPAGLIAGRYAGSPDPASAPAGCEYAGAAN